MKIRLIAFDLDGTLLDDRKRISDRCFRAMKEAADQGVVLVPATGRLLTALPKELMSLPYIRYVISLNGGVVWDTRENTVLYKRILSAKEALLVWDFMEQYKGMRDFYADGQGYMEPQNQTLMETHVLTDEMRELVRSTRNVIPDGRAKIAAGSGVEKFNLFFEAGERKRQDRARKEISEAFPFVKVTSSVVNNLEINHKEADKGRGLAALCAHLGISLSETAAFGDGDNDAAMISAAGLGVAMENGEEGLKKIADKVAPSNEDDGVARVIEDIVAGNV